MLDQALAKNTNAQIFVLSEYTLDGRFPIRLGTGAGTCAFSRRRRKRFRDQPHLLQHGLRCRHERQDCFQAGQERADPVFRRRLPAPEQEVWNSPWGKIGICICYDLSYTRVTDRLVKQGAQLLIVRRWTRKIGAGTNTNCIRASHPCARRNMASRFSASPVPAFRRPSRAAAMSSRKHPSARPAKFFPRNSVCRRTARCRWTGFSLRFALV